MRSVVNSLQRHADKFLEEVDQGMILRLSFILFSLLWVSHIRAAEEETKQKETAAELDEQALEDRLQWVRTEEEKRGSEIVETLDVDGDGFPEIRRIFFTRGNARTLSRKEIDLNADGKFDIVRLYEDGQLAKVLTDLDYDGKADLVSNFRHEADKKKDVLVSKEYSFHRDGITDVVLYFVNDQIFKKEIDRDRDGTPDRFDYYTDGRLMRTELDDNNDGLIDSWGSAADADRFPYLKDKPKAASQAPVSTPEPADSVLTEETTQAQKPVNVKDAPKRFSNNVKKLPRKTLATPSGKKVKKPSSRLPASQKKSQSN